MSLLEDVFLEDEAGEAQELERVIEGDEFDERPEPVSGQNSNENSEKEDEAEEDKRRVDPTSTKTKRITKNPRFVLNPARLTGPRGIQVIPEHFKDFKFKGKGHEKEDLDLVLKKLEHWAYRLYPKFQFEDCLKKIETLGKKRPVMVHLHKIRSDQYISDDVVVQKDSSDDEDKLQPPAEEDEFDKLLQQQIELARSTPGPNSAKKTGFSTPRIDQSFSMPKATSSPSISDEQKERMLRNRRLAEERRLARQRNAEQNNISIINEVPIEVENHYASNDKPRSTVTDINEVVDVDNHHNQSIDQPKNKVTVANEIPIDVEYHQNLSRKNITFVNEVPFEVDNQDNETRKKLNRSNVIDSSDEDCEDLVVNESVTVDVHSSKTDSDDDTDNHVQGKKRKSNKIDSSDEHEIVIQSKAADNDEVSNIIEESVKKHTKSNVIDSSDDEVTVDKSVTIDFNDTRPENDHSIDRNKSPSEEVMNIDGDSNAEVIISSKIRQKNNEDNKVKEKNNIASTLNDEDKEFQVVNEDQNRPTEVTNTDNDSEIDKEFDTSNKRKNESSDTLHKVVDNNISEVSKNAEVTPSSNKENIDTNIDQELMDVDFSEEF